MDEDNRLRAEAAIKSAELFVLEVKRCLAIGTTEALDKVEGLLIAASTALYLANDYIANIRKGGD